jgi:diguanylate cyclase (GGDEF)-like protein
MVGDRLAAAVLDALPDATAVLDRSASILAVNRAWRMFALDNGGDADGTGVGVNYLEICARSAAAGCQDAQLAADGLRSVLAGETVQSDLEYPCPSPTANRWFLLRITPLAGREPGAVASHVNITRRKMAEDVLSREAAHDPLTSLANRDLFAARLASALAPRTGRLPRADVGVLYVDLDGFKLVNDTYGHDAGDEVLVVAAHRLAEQSRPHDTVARLGGDEFALIAPRTDAGGLAALAQRITAALAAPHLVHGRSVVVPASVGTHLAAPGESAAHALRLADQAMYTVKRSRPTRSRSR